MNRFKTFFTEFLPEVVAEMRKVSFPSRQEVIGTTGVVLVTSVIFAVYLWGVDLVILRLYDWLSRAAAKVLGSPSTSSSRRRGTPSSAGTSSTPTRGSRTGCRRRCA